jgi:hypothetical protein
MKVLDIGALGAGFGRASKELTAFPKTSPLREFP